MLHYTDLYESIVKVTTSKKGEEITELVLKKELHRDGTRRFRATREINFADLEKKMQSSPLLVTGRTLLAMAKKGNRFYKRTLSYAEQKWDCSKCEPKE